MKQPTPSITVSRASGAVNIVFSGFDTTLEPLLVERRVVGDWSWSLVATPSAGDGELVDGSAVEWVAYEYRATAGTQTAAVVAEPERELVKKRRGKPKVEPRTPQAMPIVFDPWGILDDISVYDPYATVVVPKNDGQ